MKPKVVWIPVDDFAQEALNRKAVYKAVMGMGNFWAKDEKGKEYIIKPKY